VFALSFFCFGSLAVDPVGGALNYVIALLLPPIGTLKRQLSISHWHRGMLPRNAVKHERHALVFKYWISPNIVINTRHGV
jgi:hypothetical protein